MKILLTGSNGFLGSIIKKTLINCYNLKTLGRKNSDFNFDLVTAKNLVLNENFDLIIHCAGKAHVSPFSENDKNDFIKVNVDGTINLLKTLSKCHLPKYFVFISSVSVYGLETGVLVDEEAPLLAEDPYGKSKILAESVICNWCKENNVIFTIFRLPLIVGENPKGNLKAMMHSVKKGYYFNIGDGLAERSMVLGSDVAGTIIKASKVGGIYNLTDGVHPNYLTLSKTIGLRYGKNIQNIPVWIAIMVAKIGDLFLGRFPLNSKRLSKILNTLTFSDLKARMAFGWEPNQVLNNLFFDDNE